MSMEDILHWGFNFYNNQFSKKGCKSIRGNWLWLQIPLGRCIFGVAGRRRKINRILTVV